MPRLTGFLVAVSCVPAFVAVLAAGFWVVVTAGAGFLTGVVVWASGGVPGATLNNTLVSTTKRFITIFS